MAAPLQQSLVRKLVYFALIVVLFGATLVLRQQVVLPRADSLGLRENSQGEVELTGSALRLTLTGSRGLVVCYLWWKAEEEQKKNEWNQLELTIRALTKFQPHFIRPWLFQSWNLAYNVSVESDRIRDKYFYISRGISLLADGERQNQDNPDLRGNMGLYYQNKIGLADEQTTLRCLFQMSCIDPRERDPARLRGVPGDNSAINPEEFQKFCLAQPFLVRRLRELLGCRTPGEVVDFLEANHRVPSLFDERRAVPGAEATPKRAPADRFPILPPRAPRSAEYEYTNESALGGEFDNFAASRAWYNYAQEPVEPPLLRIPRMMAKVLFQGQPPRAQAYIAERLQKEGWFDEEPWTITEWFPQPVPVGDDGRNWSGDAWERARQMYVDHARAHGLDATPEEQTKFSEPMGQRYRMDQNITNIVHWLVSTEVERTRDAVDARKAFWKADRLRRRAEPRKAVAQYEDVKAFGPPNSWTKDKASGWTRIYYDHPRLRADMTTQEDTYEVEMKYMDLITDVRGARLLAARAAASVVAEGPTPGAFWHIPAELAGQTGTPRLRGPFDGTDDHGQPLVSQEAIRIVNIRRGILSPPTAMPETRALVPGVIGFGR